MKFIRSHITIFLVIIMSILCLCAAGVAINITRIMIQRRDQVVKVVPAGQSELNKDKSNTININKLKSTTIILNGMKIDGLNAYLNGKDNYLVPLDLILHNQGSKFKYYDSDNILEWVLKGKKNSVKLGEDGFWMGKNKVNLGTTVTAGKNHILIPIDLFTNLDGYTLNKTAGDNTVFLNYYSDYVKKFGNIKVLSQNNENLIITDLLGKKTIWSPKAGISLEGAVEPSYDGSKYLLKFGEHVYLLNAKNSSKPYKIAINPSAHWSVDSKFLYWIDAGNKMSYLYDIDNDVIRKLGDYYLKINADNSSNIINDANILFDYKKGKRYERIAFTNPAMEGNYTFIKRNGKVVIEGNLIYSPDKKRVIYYVKDEGFYYANSDATKKTLLGDAKDIRWINNNKFVMRINNQNYIVTNSGKTSTLTTSDWRLLGRTAPEQLLFSKDDVLYSEVDGVEKEIKKLPWPCDEVTTRSIDGPFFAVTSKGKGIYFIDKDNIIRIGTYKAQSEILDKPKETVLKRLALSYSPEGKYIAYYQEENGFLSLNLFNIEDYEQKKILLDFPVNNKTGFEDLTVKWATNSLLLVFSNSRWCSVDIKNSIKVFTQSGGKDTSIYGIFVK